MIKSATPCRPTNGTSSLYNKSGGSNQASMDFDALNPTIIKNTDEVRVGKTENGDTVISRSKSTDGRVNWRFKGERKRLKSDMMNNIKKWVPALDVPETIYIESITDDYDGLKVLLAGEDESKHSFEMIFTDYYGYRNFNESERLKTLNNSSELTVEWGLFIAENTDFINWLHNESLEIIDKSQIKQYIITTPDDILEVLSSAPPKINTVKRGTNVG